MVSKISSVSFSLDVKNCFFVLCDFFGQIHSTSLNFSLQIGLWTKKHSVFVFVSILMTMSYMSLEIFSFEWIQILNGTKVWQYHRLSHHKIWATSIHIWFFEFHTTIESFYLCNFFRSFPQARFALWAKHIVSLNDDRPYPVHPQRFLLQRKTSKAVWSSKSKLCVCMPNYENKRSLP